MTEKEYEYILNPKTGKLVKTCGNIGMKLIKNYEYDEIYNPETKRTVNFNKTTGKKVYKKYGKYIEKYSKKGGAVATAAITCPASYKLKICKKLQPSTCSVQILKRDPQQKNNSCRFILPKFISSTASFDTTSSTLNSGNTSNAVLLYPLPEFSENVNEKSYLDMYSVPYEYGETKYKVSSTLNTTNNLIEVVQQTTTFPPPPPPPPLSTLSIYQFDCEPSNAKQVCNSSSMQTNETLKKLFQILAAYIDTIVMLLNPQFLSIFTVEWLKNVVIEYIFNEILNLVIPYQINNETNLVPIIVRTMMGDNLITISAKLTLKQVAPDYTANLPQVIIKNNVVNLLNDFPKFLNEKYKDTLIQIQIQDYEKILNENDTQLKDTFNKLKSIVDTISDNFDITVKEERS